ncbi:DUF418 domain-containing protein [Phytoactinopolyspora limicola]|uniref:DUF418 domain-containing protein n=1 Tax=Phytoactinopolyspora limicola TaxID=2715536 RepID=UPI00140BDFCD|nr:DUF418 domain-containing protein [Phytoactinopolyspora limicola]
MRATSASAQPVVNPGRRIGELDAIRGFALFGILITNVIVVSTLLTVSGDDGASLLFDGAVDNAVGVVVDALFLGKFFLLFSFLFGYSFTLQLDAAARAGARAVPRLLRRCAALFVIGLLHAAFLWFGDILTLYAGLCLILIVLRNIRPITAFIAGVGILLAPAALHLLPDDEDKAANVHAPGGSDDSLAFLDFSWVHEAFTGGPMDTLAAQLTVAPDFMGVIWSGQGPSALGMFLLGMAAGKIRFMNSPVLSAWSARLQWIGLLIGGPVVVWTIVVGLGDGDLPGYADAITTVTNPLITFFYAATIIRLAQGRAGARLVAALAPAGRMAATNYIAQSAVFMLIYTGYGFALVDRVPPLGVIAIALVTFAVQLAGSHWWLRRFKYGPVEWVLRAVTNARIPAWRRPS